MKGVTSSQEISSVLTQENSIPCTHLTLPLRTVGFFLFLYPKEQKKSVCVDILFFTITASLAFQIVKCLKGLSLDVGYVQFSVVRGQGKKGINFSPAFRAQIIECARFNIR